MFQIVTLNSKEFGTQVSPSWFCLPVSTSLSLPASFLRPLPSSSSAAYLLSTPSSLPPTSALCSSSTSRLSLLSPTFCLSQLFPASVNTRLIGFLPSSWLTNASKQGLIYSSSFGVFYSRGCKTTRGRVFIPLQLSAGLSSWEKHQACSDRNGVEQCVMWKMEEREAGA